MKVKKLSLAGLFCALAVVGSLFSVPLLGSRCAPVQHCVNVLCAVLLGPWWAFGAGFVASLLRNLLGLGSLLAFPGSMFGALLAGLAYGRFQVISAALVGEVVGTSVLGGLSAYPLATFFMGQGGKIAFYSYVFPFFLSTVAGALVAGLLLFALERSGFVQSMRRALKE